MTKKEKIEKVEKARNILYRNHGVYKCITDFYNIGRDRGGFIAFNRTKDMDDSLIRQGAPDLIVIKYLDERLMPLVYPVIYSDSCHTYYFQEYIFNKRLLEIPIKNLDKAEKAEVVGPNIIGAMLVMDIDAPNIRDNFGKGKIIGRENFFDFVDYFNVTLIAVAEELREVKKGWRCMFTGNGLLVITDPFYSNDAGKIERYSNNFIDMCNDINQILLTYGVGEDRDKGIKGINIHDKQKAWSYFYKGPWAIHVGAQRVAIPMKYGSEYKGKLKIDENWLENVTRIDNFNGEKQCDMTVKWIMKEAKEGNKW